MRWYRERNLIRGFFITALFVFFILPDSHALEINGDGKALIAEAQHTYRSDMENRPVVNDDGVKGYAYSIIEKLVPKTKKLPDGVNISVTLLDSPQPELYSYVDGHIVMTMGVLFAMGNEAQLAGVLSHEVANIVEGYYIDMYQQIKAAERNQRSKAVAGALFGALMDVAVDYAVAVNTIEIENEYWSKGATYSDTMIKIAGVHAAESAYYGIKDVVQSIPEKDDKGQWIDPRLRLEPIADAQGMIYMAEAGYDCRETAKGWDHLYRIKSGMVRKQEQMLGAFAEQIRQTQNLMQMNMNRMRQSLGATGLVQTRSDVPPTRAEFVAKMVDLAEVREAEKKQKPEKGKKEYQVFLEKSLVPRAEKEMREENYEKAYRSYKALWDSGVHTAPIAYGMAKSRLGDFAFGASEAEKEEAEKAYKEAARLDPDYALPYKGLGELYDDWELYEEAVAAYRTYLKKAPKSSDRQRIERKIKVLERKASR